MIMDLFNQTCFIMGMALGCLSMAEGAAPCTDYGNEAFYNISAPQFKHVFRDLCYEFTHGPKTWPQARSACRQRGGELLKLMDCPVKRFLQEFTRERNTTDLTWWLGEGVLGEYQKSSTETTCYTMDGRNYRGELAKTISGRTCQSWAAQTPHRHNRTREGHPNKGLESNYCRNPDGEPGGPWCYTTDPTKRWEYCGVSKCDAGPVVENTTENNEIVPVLCTYMKLDPLQIVTTSNCSQLHGYICTMDFRFSSDKEGINQPKHALKSRLKRSDSSGSQSMSMLVDDIDKLLQAADKELSRMELNEGEPTDTSRDNFIKYLLEGTRKVPPKSIIQNDETIGHIINCTGGIFTLSINKCGGATNSKYLFDQVFEIYKAISILVASGTNKTIVIKHAMGTFYQSSHKPAAMDHLVLGSEEDGIVIKLPSFSALKSQLGGYETVNAQVTTFTNNPHPSDGENITGILISLLLNDGSSEISLSNLPEMIEIFLPRTGPASLTNGTAVLKNGGPPVFTAFNITDANVTLFFSVETSINVSLLMVLSPGTPDHETNYTSRIMLKNTAGGHRWMVTPEMFQQTTGIWYIETTVLNFNGEQDVTLNFSSYTSKCLYWDTERMVWSNAGCRVGNKTTPHQTQCLCNHLTLFGSSFFVMPNYVDLSRTAELFSTVSQNYVVLALLCAFFGLYLITLLWACYADRRALSRRKIILLKDNHLCAQYNYLLGVQTGQRKNAGTSANVTVKLIGSEGESGTHNLADPDRPVFARGAVDMFLLATPFPLGDLHNIRLQHDNSGGHPSWYINKVTVQNLQTRQVWHFLCDCWLSADRGDAMTKKTLNAAKQNEIRSFRNIFHSRTSTGFRDEHIWLSIVDPPWRSPFTRAQRVSCCMSLLLCTMAINIAFWNIPVDDTSPVIFSIGSLRISWQEIMVGVESGLLMFPINILIVTIFRSIRPRLSSPVQKINEEQDLKTSIVTITTILKEIEELVGLLGVSKRNKVFELKARLESASDLFPALDKLHELIRLMQGEAESDPHWVYCSQFVLCCLSHLLLCLEKLDVRAFPSPEEHQQALNLTNMMLRKAEMVFSSHMAYCPSPVSKKKRPSGCSLPWWCVFLGWSLLLSISGLSTFFTLLYGFQYGKEKSIQWVISLGLSLFQSIFILQPLKVIGVAIFFALLLKPVAVEETEEAEQVLLEQRGRCRQYSGRDGSGGFST